MNSARSASSSQTVNVSSNWSTASTTRPPSGTPGERDAELAHRVRAGAQQRLRPVLAAGQHPAGQRRQQAGAQDRRLAAARRPDDAEQRRADEAGDELGDEPLASEEVARVGDVVGGQALERADDRHIVAVAPPAALARLLQVDDAAGQLGLDRAQLGAAGDRTIGDRADVAGRLAARPLPGDLVHAPRDAAAGVEQPLGGHVLDRPSGGVAGGDRAHGVGVEGAQLERVGRLDVCQRDPVLRAGDDEHVRRVQREAGELGAHAGARAIDVVEHAQQRARRRAHPAQRCEERVGGTRARRVGDGRAVAVDLTRKLLREPALARAARADQRDDATGAGPRAVPAGKQPGELVLAPDQRL